MTKIIRGKEFRLATLFQKFNKKRSALFDIVLLPEALDAAGGVYQLLLAGKEGMAGRTDFHLYILYGRAGLYYVSTGTGNFGQLIPGMNLLFHFNSSVSNSCHACGQV